MIQRAVLEKHFLIKQKNPTIKCLQAAAKKS